MKKTLLLTALTILSFTISCISTGPKKAYMGQEKPVSEVSVIDCALGVKINAIDDNTKYKGDNYRCNYAVLPGDHTVSFQYYRNEHGKGPVYTLIEKKERKVQFETKAGHRYDLMGTYNQKDKKWIFWLLEKDQNDELVKEDPKYTFIK